MTQLCVPIWERRLDRVRSKDTHDQAESWLHTIGTAVRVKGKLLSGNEHKVRPTKTSWKKKEYTHVTVLPWVMGRVGQGPSITPESQHARPERR